MDEINCPHCKKAFKIDESGYADILKQVRDNEFEKQLHERLELAEKDKKNAIELVTIKITRELERAAVAKDAEIKQAKHDKQTASQLAEARLVNELQKIASAKDTEIQRLKAQLDSIKVG